MAHRITVRGSLSPAAGVLERGETKIVEWSPSWQRKIDKGYVDLISEEFPVVVEPVATSPEAPEYVHERADGEPAGNASAEDWFDFLVDQNIEVPEEGMGRDAMRDSWYALVREKALGETRTPE